MQNIAHHLVLMCLNPTRLAPLFHTGPISCSVTVVLADSPILSKVKMTCVENANKRTKGFATEATQAIGRIANTETGLGWSCPIRAASSSSKIIVINVIAVTTIDVAEMAETLSDTPSDTRQTASPSLKAALPKFRWAARWK